jgi:predicted glycoside hydrolase/deacetylase ChbG (UPF0249 family)
MKFLIVNADDFGYSKEINKGIAYAHKNGVVTSTSLMINAPATKEACLIIKNLPRLGVGLHFVFIDETRRVVRLIKQLVNSFMIKKIEKELDDQIKKFIKLVGKPPDHLDSHYHYHKWPNVLPTFHRVAKIYKIPIRDFGGIKFNYQFYGMNRITRKPQLPKISLGKLLNILQLLNQGATELMTHPGYFTPNLIESYNFQREIELQTLTNKLVKQKIKELNIKLVNFEDKVEIFN